ncbi:hypothetical protein OPV22_021490 [Ensete ventricosum]|uniref:Uncharacterized protein n=1 Tax=Ensete ventricosum TaxID=4639 RepID=A0AAV8QSC4_ENSVE|nr:hypothetical protein OPV22_021490 [Ensete ventricosum]
MWASAGSQVTPELYGPKIAVAFFFFLLSSFIPVLQGGREGGERWVGGRKLWSLLLCWVRRTLPEYYRQQLISILWRLSLIPLSKVERL